MQRAGGAVQFEHEAHEGREGHEVDSNIQRAFGDWLRAKRAFVCFVSFSSFVLNVFGFAWVPAFAGMIGGWGGC